MAVGCRFLSGVDSVGATPNHRIMKLSCPHHLLAVFVSVAAFVALLLSTAIRAADPKGPGELITHGSMHETVGLQDHSGRAALAARAIAAIAGRKTTG